MYINTIVIIDLGFILLQKVLVILVPLLTELGEF